MAQLIRHIIEKINYITKLKILKLTFLEEIKMNYNNIDFDTYFKNYPDKSGFFGKYGGSFIPPELQNAMNEITDAYYSISKSRKFIDRKSVV